MMRRVSKTALVRALKQKTKIVISKELAAEVIHLCKVKDNLSIEKDTEKWQLALNAAESEEKTLGRIYNELKELSVESVYEGDPSWADPLTRALAAIDEVLNKVRYKELLCNSNLHPTKRKWNPRWEMPYHDENRYFLLETRKSAADRWFVTSANTLLRREISGEPKRLKVIEFILDFVFGETTGLDTVRNRLRRTKKKPMQFV